MVPVEARLSGSGASVRSWCRYRRVYLAQVQSRVGARASVITWSRDRRQYLVRVQLGEPGTGAAGYSGEGQAGYSYLMQR